MPVSRSDLNESQEVVTACESLLGKLKPDDDSDEVDLQSHLLDTRLRLSKAYGQLVGFAEVVCSKLQVCCVCLCVCMCDA